MSENAHAHLTDDLKLRGVDTNAYTTMDMIDASMYGGNVKFGFGGTNYSTDPAQFPQWGDAASNPTPVYLTFSGGGHALQFSMASSENIDSFGYEWSLEAEATGIENDAHAFGISVLGRSFANAVSDSKSSGLTHAMAWAKYGNLETSYVLGDSDPFDKFVIQVSSDKRFGTPLFKTIGGASRCPGEPNTMWRETDVKIDKTPWSAGANNHFIPPDSPALFDVVITNASPYRETLNYVLLLTSDQSYTDDFGGNMFDLTFTINGDRLRPFGDVFSLNKIKSVDEAGNLKHSVLSLNIERGNFEHSYSGIGVKLVSACEWAMDSDWMYREPISDSSSLRDFKWERKCPRVTWDKTTYNKFSTFVASREKPPFMNITLMNPEPMNLWTGDRWNSSGIQKMKDGEVPSESDQNVGWDSKKNHLVHPNVEFVRIQWRKTGVGEWINAWDIDWSSWEDITDADGQLLEKNFGNFFNKYPFDGKESSRRKQMQELFKLDIHDADSQCATSRGAGCTLKWNLARQYFLSGLNDGSYDIRAKTFCSGYDAFATSEVRGSVTDENLSLFVDVSAPKATQSLTLDRVLRIDYSEPINCPELSKSSMAYEVKRVKACDGDDLDDGSVSEERVYFNYTFQCTSDPPYSLVIEFPKDSLSGTYEVTVNANIDSVGEKVADAGGNSAEKQMFLTTIGCPVENPTSSLGKDSKAAITTTKENSFLPSNLGDSGPAQETNWRFSSNTTLDAFLACVIFAIGFAASTASRSVRLRSNPRNELETEQNTSICTTSRQTSYGSVL